MMPVSILASARIVTLGDDRPATVAERPGADSVEPIRTNGHICPREPGSDLTGRRRLS
ncbi:hypothetical protein JJ691_99770 [Kutzneria sp. CA-103260]|nr:hypothetical protein JJ691_99770 [Kutzneria sp. CA-103260]